VRKVAIVGAGQAGLVLAHLLRARRHQVTIVTNKRPEQVFAGRILSNQCMWDDALQIERDLGLALWDEACPPIPGFAVSVLEPDGRPRHAFTAGLSQPGQSVDQRLKFSRWMTAFTDRGGAIDYVDVDLDVLEALAATHDLVVVATGRGRGAMKGFFAADEARSISRRPERIGGSIYVTGRTPDDRDGPELERWVVIPGVGELWIIPALTVRGPGHIICVEGVPGGPLDVWASAATGDDHLATMMGLLRTWVPDEAARCREAVLADPLAWLSGGAVSGASQPIRRLPSGRAVLAIADSFVLNDPISQQGSNNATQAAKLYAERITAHGDRPFDDAWMRQVCADYWQFVRWSVALTRMFLAPPAAFHRWLARAAGSPRDARLLADCNNRPADFLRALGYAAGDAADLPVARAMADADRVSTR
jgi:hypothetical protein